MTNQSISHPSTDEAILAVAETLTEVVNKLTCDLDLVALSCASHDQALLAIMDEVERLRVANAQLYIRLRHLERRGQNHEG